MAHAGSDLALRRNLVALRHLLDYVRFVAAVVLDRLGIVSLQGEMLPGEPWAELVDTAAMERLMEAAFWEPSSSPMIKRSVAAPQHWLPSAEDREAAADDASEAICTICMSRLGVGGRDLQVTELRNCSHAFHAACIDSWIAGGEAGTCPLCRTPTLPTAWS